MRVDPSTSTTSSTFPSNGQRAVVEHLLNQFQSVSEEIRAHLFEPRARDARVEVDASISTLARALARSHFAGRAQTPQSAFVAGNILLAFPLELVA